VRGEGEMSFKKIERIKKTKTNHMCRFCHKTIVVGSACYKSTFAFKYVIDSNYVCDQCNKNYDINKEYKGGELDES